MVHDPFSFVKFKSEVYMLAKRFELEPKSYVAFAVGSICACTVMLPEPFVRKDKSELEAFVVIKLFYHSEAEQQSLRVALYQSAQQGQSLSLIYIYFLT